MRCQHASVPNQMANVKLLGQDLTRARLDFCFKVLKTINKIIKGDFQLRSAILKVILLVTDLSIGHN